MPTVGTLSIASGGLVTGSCVHSPDTDGTIAKNNTRQVVAILADGELLGRVTANLHNTGNPVGYDSEHGYSFQLPSSLLDGVTVHTIEALGNDGVFASQTGTLS